MATTSTRTKGTTGIGERDRADAPANDRADAGSGRFGRVLVAVDGGTDREVAAVAVSLAARYDAQVDALSVVQMNASIDHWDMVIERREADAEAALDAVGDAGVEAGVPVAKRLRYGDPAEEIELYARGNDADLIVVGEPDRTGLRRLLSPRSVTDRVRRSASAPVLAVPASDGGSKAAGSVGPAALGDVERTA